MKFHLGVLALLLKCSVTASEYFPHLVFNGNVQESGKSCLPEEWTLIINSVNPKNKYAIGDGNSTHDAVNGTIANSDPVESAPSPPIGGRSLGRGRKQDCASKYTFFACGKPVDDRRLETNARAGLRGLRDKCRTDLEKINATLTSLTPSLSSSCQALVQTPMQVECMEKVDCDIAHFTLWDTKSNTVVVEKVPETGAVFCHNTTLTFEAHTRFDVGNVHFSWTGPMWPGTVWGDKLKAFMSPFNRTDPVSPYYMFGRNGTQPFGMRLPQGNFTLTASSSKDPSKAKKISFRMIKC